MDKKRVARVPLVLKMGAMRVATIAVATFCAALLTVTLSRYAKPMYVRRARKLLNAAVMVSFFWGGD